MTMKDWVCKGFSINIFDRSMSKHENEKRLIDDGFDYRYFDE